MGKDETVKVETQKLLLKTFDNQPLDNIRCFLPTVSVLVLLHLSPPYSFTHLILPKLPKTHSFHIHRPLTLSYSYPGNLARYCFS